MRAATCGWKAFDPLFTGGELITVPMKLEFATAALDFLLQKNPFKPTKEIP